MKFFCAVAVLSAANGAWASDGGRVPGRVVTVCLRPWGEATNLSLGRQVASRVLQEAGVRLKWRNDERACIATGNGIVIEASIVTPADQNPGALASALPFERIHVVLFYDRVLLTVAPAVVPYLLGHVLAHEIVHMLLGTDEHSASGVMKARWDNQDFDRMQEMRLHLTDADLLGIQAGLARPSRPAPVD
jgi:hypothetical protein